MRILAIIAGLVLMATLDGSAQQFKVITSVESIVPSGLGRSTILNAQEDKDYKDYTSIQTK